MSSTTTPTPPLFENLGHALSTDYFFLREQLSEDELSVLRRVRRFVDDEVLPVIGRYWERAELPWPLIRRLGELGIVGEEVTGLRVSGPQPDRLRAQLHMGAQPRRRGASGTLLGVQSGLAMEIDRDAGLWRDQKQRWLPEMARLEKASERSRSRNPTTARTRWRSRRGRAGTAITL